MSWCTPPPVGLTIAGTDPSGGAGIQADLKTFSALGVYATSVVTALVAQATEGVRGVQTVGLEFLRLQWRTLVDDVRIDVIKIGMLATAELADTVAEFIDEGVADDVVLDPVMVAASGDRLLDEAATDAVVRLCRQVSLITPNLPEAAVLLDRPPAETVAGMRGDAQRLIELGVPRVLLKGGHMSGSDSVDIYADADGLVELSAPRVETTNSHGTGCSLSSAIASFRAHGASWPEACSLAKDWLTQALRASDSLDIGKGSGPVHHFHQLWNHSEETA